MQESRVFRLFEPRNPIREFLYEIQRLTGFQSFPRTLTAHHASPPMDGPDPFGTPLFYHVTLSCDLGLILRARRGFAYRDFATGEDEGSCPLVSPGAETPKCRNLFTPN
jgi:hypothetical protein